MGLRMCRLQEGIKWVCSACKRAIPSYTGVSLNRHILCNSCAEKALDRLQTISDSRYELESNKMEVSRNERM